MRILTRHVVAELLKVFFLVLTAMTALMLTVGVVKEAVDQGLGIAQVARLLPFILPDALRFTVPGTVLFAASSVYGRMSGGNEIVALKSMGISPWPILVPGLVLGFLFSLATVWLNDVAVSWGRNGVQRVVIGAVEEIAYGMLRTQRAYSTRQFSINVKSVEGRKLIQPILTFQGSADSPPVTVQAESAELRSDIGANVLRIICQDVWFSVDGKLNGRDPGKFEREIPLIDSSASIDKSTQPSHLPLRKIPEQIVEQKALIKLFEQERAAKAAYQMLTGDFNALAGDEWRHHAYAQQAIHNRLHRLETEPHRRWSNGFSCFCFVLIGAAMAIRQGNTEFLKSFFACFLPVLVVYYPLLAFGVDNAKSGALPPYTVWLGNIILLVWGAWLMRRVMRY